MPLIRALTRRLAQSPTLGLLARMLRENGRAYLPRYAVAFVFMGLFAGCTALSAWMMKDVNPLHLSKYLNRLYLKR